MSGQAANPDVSDLTWFKSSHSAGDGGECVEVAAHKGVLHMRDSKQEVGPVLSLTAHAWSEFVRFAAQQA